MKANENGNVIAVDERLAIEEPPPKTGEGEERDPLIPVVESPACVLQEEESTKDMANRVSHILGFADAPKKVKRGRPATPKSKLLMGMVLPYLVSERQCDSLPEVLGSSQKYRNFEREQRDADTWDEDAQRLITALKTAQVTFPPGEEERFLKGLPPKILKERPLSAIAQKKGNSNQDFLDLVDKVSAELALLDPQQPEEDGKRRGRPRAPMSKSVAVIGCVFLKSMRFADLPPELGSPQTYQKVLREEKKAGTWRQKAEAAALVLENRGETFPPGQKEAFLWGSSPTPRKEATDRMSNGLYHCFRLNAPPAWLETSYLPPSQFCWIAAYLYVNGKESYKLPKYFDSMKNKFDKDKGILLRNGQWGRVAQFIVTTLEEKEGMEYSPEQQAAFIANQPPIAPSPRPRIIMPIHYQTAERQKEYKLHSKALPEIVLRMTEKIMDTDRYSVIRFRSSAEPSSVQYLRDLCVWGNKYKDFRKELTKQEEELEKLKISEKAQGGPLRQKETEEQEDLNSIMDRIAALVGPEDQRSRNAVAIQEALRNDFESIGREFLSVVSPGRPITDRDLDAFFVFVLVYLGRLSYRKTRPIYGNDEKFRKIHKRWRSIIDLYKKGIEFLVSKLEELGFWIPKDRIRALQYGKRVPPEEKKQRGKDGPKNGNALSREDLAQFLPEPLVQSLIPPSERKEGSHGGRPRSNIYLILEIIQNLMIRQNFASDQLDNILDLMKSQGLPTVSSRTLREHIRYWRENNLLAEIRTWLLLAIYKAGGFDLVISFIDATQIRAENHHKFVGWGNPKKGQGVLAMVITDLHGNILAFVLGNPNKGEKCLITKVVEDLPAPLRKAVEDLVGDKGFDSTKHRLELLEKYGIFLRVQNRCSTRNCALTEDEAMVAEIMGLKRHRIENSFAANMKQPCKMMRYGFRAKSAAQTQCFMELFHVFHLVSIMKSMPCQDRKGVA